MRTLNEQEFPLVKHLLELARIPVSPSALLVQPMADGGMGSLAFAPLESSRKLGATASECVFQDSDGVPVSAALNLDREGVLFEIDIFKADFSPLKRWPTKAQLLDSVR